MSRACEKRRNPWKAENHHEINESRENESFGNERIARERHVKLWRRANESCRAGYDMYISELWDRKKKSPKRIM